MSLNPDAHNLLATALELFRAEIMPHIPPEKRYTALMIANALTMVEREIDGGRDGAEAFLAAAEAVFEDTLTAEPAQVTQRLADEIEAGAFDAPGPKRDAAFRCLKALIASQLAITNPKLLRDIGRPQASRRPRNTPLLPI